MIRSAAIADVPWSLWTIGLVAVAAHLLLWFDVPLPRLLLPVAALIAAAIRRPRMPGVGGLPVLAVVGAGFVAIAIGSVASFDRSWDGFATWSLTARRLAESGTLDQPFFADPFVYSYGRGYPLLQPVLLAQVSAWLGDYGGRLLFPVLWVLLVAGLVEPLRRAGVPERIRQVAVVGLALVPIFVEPGGGSAESGFADVFVAMLALHAGAALVSDARALAFVSCLLLPLVKNEGIVHAVLLIAVAAVAGRRRVASWATLGTTAALVLWLPLQDRLLAPGTAHAMRLSTFAPAAVPLVVLALASGVRNRRLRWITVATGAVGVLALSVLAPAESSPLGMAVGTMRRLELAWSSVPGILGSAVAQLFWVRKLGLTFVVLIAAAAAAGRRPTPFGSAAPLCALIVLAGAAIVAFLTTRPPGELELFLAEGLVRYTAQWSGVAWLAIGLLLVEPQPEPATPGPRRGETSESP